MVKRILKTISVLLVVVLLSTVSVFGVKQLTQPIIDARNAGASNEALIELVENGDSAKDVTKNYSNYNEAEITAIFEVYNDAEELIAYGVNVNTTGYHSELIYVLAFDATGKILGFVSTSNKETSGIGADLLEDESFREQFKDLTFDSNKTDIDMQSGPTADHTLSGIQESFAKVSSYCKSNIIGGAE